MNSRSNFWKSSQSEMFPDNQTDQNTGWNWHVVMFHCLLVVFCGKQGHTAIFCQVLQHQTRCCWTEGTTIPSSSMSKSGG